MLRSEWLTKFPGRTIVGVMEYLNTFNLGLSKGQKGKIWWVATGEKILLETDEEEIADAFFLGMAISYIALPADLIEQIRERFGT